MKEIIIKISIILSIVLIVVYNFFIKDKPDNGTKLIQNYMFESQTSNSINPDDETSNGSTNTNNQETSHELNRIKIYITGEVNNPGVYELDEGSRIEDAIFSAGGISSEASLKDVNLAFILEDAMKIYIPNKTEEIDSSQVVSLDSSNYQDASISSNHSMKSEISSKVNVNKASSSDLENIPGIGPSTAQKIITYREEHGKFSSIDDIKNVSGIGTKKFEKIKEYITI